MKRDKFPTRRFVLISEEVRQRAHAALDNVPIDPEHPVQMLLSEQENQRKKTQNALMWSGPLRDMERQAYVNGRTFKDDVWHEHFKREFLPEEWNEEECLSGYRKWDFTPTGERVLVGSTTELTVKGFSNYLEQIYAFGATEYGVMFSMSKNQIIGRKGE